MPARDDASAAASGWWGSWAEHLLDGQLEDGKLRAMLMAAENVGTEQQLKRRVTVLSEGIIEAIRPHLQQVIGEVDLPVMLREVKEAQPVGAQPTAPAPI